MDYCCITQAENIWNENNSYAGLHSTMVGDVT